MTGYCTTRHELEQQSWGLTSRHSALTGRLIALIGKGHTAYADALENCHTAHQDVANAHRNLRDHRDHHGC